MKIYRVRPHEEGGPCAVLNPTTQNHEVPNPAHDYRGDHILVQTYPWLFREIGADVEADDLSTETTRQRPGTRCRTTRKGGQ